MRNCFGNAMITGLFVVICGAMTACGGGAVPEKDAPDVRREKKKNSRFVTDTNMYLNVEGEEEAWTECFQARLDETGHKKYFKKKTLTA